MRNFPFCDICGNCHVNLADFGLQKRKNDFKLVRDSNSSLKFLTFQLSNVSESNIRESLMLETIEYAFDRRLSSLQLTLTFLNTKESLRFLSKNDNDSDNFFSGKH